MTDAANELELYRKAFETIDAVCRRASEGDLEARIVNTQDFGDLAGPLIAINKLLDEADAFVRESAASLEYASQRKYYRPFLLRGMLGDFRRGAQVINSARESMKRRHELTEEFQTTVTNVVGVFTDAAARLETTAKDMSADAETTHKQSLAVSSAAEESAVNAKAVAAGTEELSASISEIGHQTQQSMTAAQTAAEEMQAANEAASALGEAAQRIEKVAAFIKDIAGQTNLLALNATIEAARAGEAGKGFAVVAGEVKALATQVAEATSDITAQIGSIREASERTGKSISGIEARINDVNEVTTAIASAIQEQEAATSEISSNVAQAAEGAQDISGNVVSITEASQKTGTAAGEVLQSAQYLAGEADTLKSKVQDFLEKINTA
jgi:methyl-accepting chemotaxis protein